MLDRLQQPLVGRDARLGRRGSPRPRLVLGQGKLHTNRWPVTSASACSNRATCSGRSHALLHKSYPGLEANDQPVRREKLPRLELPGLLDHHAR